MSKLNLYGVITFREIVVTRKKLGRVLERIKKKQLGTKKQPYPAKLKFLKSLPFSAITKLRNPDGEKVVTRIELTVPKAREVVEALQRLDELEKKCASLEGRIEQLKEDTQFTEEQCSELVQENARLSYNNEQLLKNIEGKPFEEDEDFVDDDTEESSLHSTMSKIEETVTNPKPFQGGSPGLKKR